MRVTVHLALDDWRAIAAAIAEPPGRHDHLIAEIRAGIAQYERAGWGVASLDLSPADAVFVRAVHVGLPCDPDETIADVERFLRRKR